MGTKQERNESLREMCFVDWGDGMMGREDDLREWLMGLTFLESESRGPSDVTLGAGWPLNSQQARGGQAIASHQKAHLAGAELAAYDARCQYQIDELAARRRPVLALARLGSSLHFTVQRA